MTESSPYKADKALKKTVVSELSKSDKKKDIKFSEIVSDCLLGIWEMDGPTHASRGIGEAVLIVPADSYIQLDKQSLLTDFRSRVAELLAEKTDSDNLSGSGLTLVKWKDVIKASQIEDINTKALRRRFFLSHSLHQRVEEKALELFEDGHFQQCVRTTFIDLDNRIENFSKLDETGTDLMGRALGSDGVIEVDGDNDKEDAYMKLCQGAMLWVRNEFSHDASLDPAPEVALEWLAFASALHRILDGAKRKGTP